MKQMRDVKGCLTAYKVIIFYEAMMWLKSHFDRKILCVEET